MWSPVPEGFWEEIGGLSVAQCVVLAAERGGEGHQGESRGKR